MKIYLGVLALLTVTSANVCKPNEFECANGHCIPLVFVCDGFNDCGDMSDEPEDTTKCLTCEEKKMCDNGNCIPLAFACDGDNDCRDWSDEPEDTTLCPTCEEKGMFTCASNGNCTLLSNFCNGFKDCEDGSDEPSNPDDCPACSGDLSYRCDNGVCINEAYLCNSYNDCGDWTDESEKKCPCAEDEIRCSTPEPIPGEPSPPGGCIPPEWICDADGISDCADGFDEANCTTRAYQSVSHIRVRPVKSIKVKAVKGKLRKPIHHVNVNRKLSKWYK